MTAKTLVIDAKNAVLGRLSSEVAKELKEGHKVHIINAEKAIILGSKEDIIQNYIKKRQTGSPHHGPFYPKNPDSILRRTVRGMMPYKTKKGRNHYSNLRVHVNIPHDLKDKEAKGVGTKNINAEFITLESLSKSLGWKGS